MNVAFALFRASSETIVAAPGSVEAQTRTIGFLPTIVPAFVKLFFLTRFVLKTHRSVSLGIATVEKRNFVKV